VITNDVKVSYTIRIAWKDYQPSYPLGSGELNWCDMPTLWVKVEWVLQSDWKWSVTWQEENFSDLYTWEMRWIIRKNATQLTQSMKNGTIVNWVKYIEWNDITLPDEEDFGKYETIVVKNGNVFIGKDLLPTKLLWIIVLKDNYDVNKDYQVAWNVYVKNDVRQINAIIYADWALRSAKDSNWTSYTGDEDSMLTDTLDIKWSLFTRNTIWWATQLAWKSYLLPWGKELIKNLENFRLAEKYDLNYVRKVKLCNLEDYSLKITYDPRVQTSPPKGFSK
jgi:hypothetical protein